MAADQEMSIPSENDGGVDISPEKDGGVLKKILKDGEGDECPCVGSEVFVHYTGTLLNGEKFDSSRDRDDLFSFKLGEGNFIIFYIDLNLAIKTNQFNFNISTKRVSQGGKGVCVGYFFPCSL